MNRRPVIDNGGRRTGGDRRAFSYGIYLPERRLGKDRRCGSDRRAKRYKRDDTEFRDKYVRFGKVQRWLFRKEGNVVASGKAANALKESPRSGKENIVWFPPDFGRKHRPRK